MTPLERIFTELPNIYISRNIKSVLEYHGQGMYFHKKFDDLWFSTQESKHGYLIRSIHLYSHE
jgi:hypothetical protein